MSNFGVRPNVNGVSVALLTDLTGVSGPVNTVSVASSPSVTLGATEVTIATITITPSAATAKVLVMARVDLTKDTGTTARVVSLRIRRGSTNSDTQIGTDSVVTSPGVASAAFGPGMVFGVDTPGVTTAVTYTVRGVIATGAATAARADLVGQEQTGPKGDTGSAGPAAPLPMYWSANGPIVFTAHEAMTLSLASTYEAGTGTILYEKALAATPTTFTTVTTSVTLAAGDKLRATVSGISGYKSVTLPRTA